MRFANGELRFFASLSCPNEPEDVRCWECGALSGDRTGEELVTEAAWLKAAAAERRDRDVAYASFRKTGVSVPLNQSLQQATIAAEAAWMAACGNTRLRRVALREQRHG